MSDIDLTDLDADPYSVVIAALRAVLNKGLDREGKMSDQEFQHLLDIDNVLRY